MGRNVLEYRCLLISPGDVTAERDAVADVVARWNGTVGPILGCRVELVRWQTHAAPDASEEPQKVINRQIVDDCELAVAVFWTRLGSATSTHVSGSVEEIERLLKRKSRVLIYFSSAPIPQERLGDDQFKDLQQFKKSLQSRGLLGAFSDVADLREQVQLHLTKALAQLVEEDRGQRSPQARMDSGSAVLTAPPPDVRVHVYPVVAMPSTSLASLIRVSVENHSPIPVFVPSLSIILNGGRGLYPQRDAITREFQRRRRLEPGESFQFFLDPKELVSSASVSEVDCVSAFDDVGRSYSSKTGELQAAFAKALKLSEDQSDSRDSRSEVH